MKKERWLNHVGFWSRRPLGWWRALCSCMLCCIVLLLLGLPSYASEQSDLMDSLRLHLQTTLAQLTDLEGKLQTWKLLSAESEKQAQVLSLELAEQRQELGTLRGELEALQTFSADSQRRAEALRISLSESGEKLRLLSKTCLDSANSWKTVADTERMVARKWKFAAMIGGVCALLVGGTIGYLAGRIK